MPSSIDHIASVPDQATLDAWIETAYRDHAAAIHAVALRSTRDPEAAADVTQEVFLRLFTEARAGRSPDNVRAWLYRASANLIVSRARRATVARRFAPLFLCRDTPAEPDAISIDREQHSALALALSTLPAIERTALLMAAQGASGIEIAGYVGRSEAATRTMMCRARLRLRITLTEACTVESSAAERLHHSLSVLDGTPA
jgi:RNA polymerase sigma-70 factor (ECF subfamily)